MTEHLSQELLRLLGEDDFFRLVEALGGLRIYMASTKRVPEVDEALGPEASNRLHDAYAGSFLRVPLARDFRARHYRASGLDNSAIARKLGLTVTGVDKLFRRAGHPRRPRQPDDRQTDLFS